MTIRIDYSTASDLQCSTRAWLRHVKGLQMRGVRNEPALAGQVVHEWMQGFFHRRSERELDDLLIQSHLAHFPEAPTEERFQLGNMMAILQAVMRYRREVGWPFAVRETEKAFEFQSFPEADMTFFGRIDAVVQSTDGQIDILDIKSTGSALTPAWASQWETSGQLLGYVLAARQLWPEQKIRGAWVYGIRMASLPPADGNMQRKCSMHKAPYADCQFLHVQQMLRGPIVFTEAQIQARVKLLKGAASTVRFLKTHAQSARLLQEGMDIYVGGGNLCGTCEFKPFCWTLNREDSALAEIMEPRPAY